MSKKLKFGPWQVWPGAPGFNEVSFTETLDGGQAFRWNRIRGTKAATEDSRPPQLPENKGGRLSSNAAEPIAFEGRWGRNVVRLRINLEGRASARPKANIEFAAPSNFRTEVVIEALNDYFTTDIDFTALTDALPWRSDPALKTAIEAFPGLRILRQPLSETLFGFLCSSTKQIPQIKAICEAVAQDLGEPLPDGSHALPSWAQIADGGEDRLRAAKLGYRARYIHQTALFLAEHSGYLQQVEAAPTEEARTLLMQLPGVGRKIADCTLLFGMGRLEAFPIDTWVQKILTRAYGLDGWKTEQLLDFARIHFGPAAGYAQQYLFAAARAGKIAS